MVMACLITFTCMTDAHVCMFVAGMIKHMLVTVIEVEKCVCYTERECDRTG